MQGPRRDEPTRISYTPPVPDGPDRPWTRGRRTRWWLVVLADTISVALIACFAAASAHDLAQVTGMLVRGGVAVVVAWAVTWLVRRPGDTRARFRRQPSARRQG